jgi:hypothetical protein
MSVFLTELKSMIAALPMYPDEPPRWVIHSKHYAIVVHSQYKVAKAIRKAKARKKRINARCGR